tara:strand:- start:596 stop:2254 length:1659 start_codon:yes stop_codon:yes gene_type:complete
MFKKAILYWNTIIHLKLIQIIGQIKQRTPFKRTKVPIDISIEINPLLGRWIKTPRKEKRMINFKEFKFLNEIFKIGRAEDWNSITKKNLWLYNLHYFDDLTSDHSTKNNEVYQNLIDCWITDNPPFYGIGWDPYPTSIRIVNFIKWSIEGNILTKKSVESLALQARYLDKNMELHILGNHLFANAKALIFAGLFLSSNESEKWYQKGIKILNDQLSEQVLDDGGAFELSPMYHSILLEDILDIKNIHNAFNKKMEIDLDKTISQMIFWMKGMCHPDEEISFFNDSCLGVASKSNDLIGYACDLFPEKSGLIRKKLELGLIDFDNSGYSRLSNQDAVLLVDRAEIGARYIPGHAHADTLSFEMSLFKKRLIVNSGISTYEKSELRHNQRSTNSHSTVVIDKSNSSEVWDSFRVGRRADVINRESLFSEEKIIISGAHNGYSNLKGGPIHSREWILSDNKVVLNDYISGQGRHLVEVVFFLHPLINLVAVEENRVEIDLEGNIIGIQFNHLGKLDVEDSFYFPEFGMHKKNKKLIYSFNDILPINSKTQIIWNS